MARSAGNPELPVEESPAAGPHECALADRKHARDGQRGQFEFGVAAAAELQGGVRRARPQDQLQAAAPCVTTVALRGRTARCKDPSGSGFGGLEGDSRREAGGKQHDRSAAVRHGYLPGFRVRCMSPGRCEPERAGTGIMTGR